MRQSGAIDTDPRITSYNVCYTKLLRTMLGISRWTGKGGSYRTIQRFFNSSIVWVKVNWLFIRHHLLDPEEVILIGGDESVVTKSGQKSYGLDRFFSSLYGKPVPGLSSYNFV